MQTIDVATQAVLSQCEFDFTWLAAALIKSAHSRSISSSERNSGRMPTDKWKSYSDYNRRKRVLGQLFLTVIGDYAKVE